MIHALHSKSMWSHIVIVRRADVVVCIHCEDCLCTRSVTEVWSDTRGVNEAWMYCGFKQTHTSWFVRLLDWNQSPDPVSAGLETQERLLWATPGSKQQKSRWKTASNTAEPRHIWSTSAQCISNTQYQTTTSVPLLYIALDERVYWMHTVNVHSAK